MEKAEMSEIDFEADSKTVVATDEQLKTISALAKRMKELTDDVNRCKQALNIAEKKLTQIVNRDLPDAMSAAGLESFKTSDGLNVSIKGDVYASISKERRDEAFAWLEEHGFGSIIKKTVECPFSAGQDDAVAALVESLKKQEVDYAVSEGVHTNTLKALVREQLAAGKDMPFELFGIFQYKEAKLS
jgi:hypothetical protein